MENYIFSGVDMVALAREFRTPLYVMSEDEIVRRLRELKAVFDDKYDGAQTYYASKAFLTKDMVRILKREDIGLDVVSGGELYIARELGFDMSKIMFHGNNKTVEEIDFALRCRIGRFVCDSIDEMLWIDQIARNEGKKATILIRVTPGVDSHTHSYISTAMKDSKFGVPLSEMMQAVEIGMKLENVHLSGFHFHVGSQLLENTSHLMAVDILLGVIREASERLGFVTEEFDLGGGFGVYYTKGDKPMPPSYFIEPMVARIHDFCRTHRLHMPRLMVEPGRWVVGEAGITLYTIGSIKEIPNIRTYVGIDGGFPDNPRPALYQADYEAVVANKMDQELVQTVTIAGKCCESGDILIKDLRVPELERGDILAVKSTGAYNYSMASNYNKNPIPSVVMIREGVPVLSVRRQTTEEMYERDL